MKRYLKAVIREFLSDKQRQVLKQYYIEGKTIQQIADEVGVDKSTISRRIKTAKKILKKFRKIYSEVA